MGTRNRAFTILLRAGLILVGIALAAAVRHGAGWLCTRQLELATLVAIGDTDAIRWILRYHPELATKPHSFKSAPVSGTSGYKWDCSLPPILMAGYRGNLPLFDLLVAHGANSQAAFKGWTPLHAAVCGGHDAFARELIGRGIWFDGGLPPEGAVDGDPLLLMLASEHVRSLGDREDERRETTTRGHFAEALIRDGQVYWMAVKPVSLERFDELLASVTSFDNSMLIEVKYAPPVQEIAAPLRRILCMIFTYGLPKPRLWDFRRAPLPEIEPEVLEELPPEALE